MGTNSRDVAIVGGGLAGLATAAYLTRGGHRVTVFERSQSLGGRATTTEHNGYFHNMGPHALYQGGTATSVLEELGVEYSGRAPDLRGVAVHRGRVFTLPTSGRSMVGTRLFGVRSRMEAGRQLLALRKPRTEDTRTVRQWLDEEFHEPAARDYLEALIRLATYSNAPETVPLRDAATQFAGVTRGVKYLDGGWQTLVRSLETSVVAAGAEVRRGVRAEEVTFADGRVTGLRLAAGERFEADAVVVAVTPDAAAELLGPASPVSAIAKTTVAARAACLDVGLTRLPNPRRGFALGIDVPYYFSVHSTWAELAPKGRVLASVAKYLHPDEPRDGARDLAELETFLDQVQPGWRAFEEHRQYLPNMVVQSAVPSAAAGGIAGRPKPGDSGVQGLFLAGDWVGQGGWLADGTLGSAGAAAEAVSFWLATAPARQPAPAGVS